MDIWAKNRGYFFWPTPNDDDDCRALALAVTSALPASGLDHNADVYGCELPLLIPQPASISIDLTSLLPYVICACADSVPALSRMPFLLLSPVPPKCQCVDTM